MRRISSLRARRILFSSSFSLFTCFPLLFYLFLVVLFNFCLISLLSTFLLQPTLLLRYKNIALHCLVGLSFFLSLFGRRKTLGHSISRVLLLKSPHFPTSHGVFFFLFFLGFPRFFSVDVVWLNLLLFCLAVVTFSSSSISYLFARRERAGTTFFS